MLQVWKVASMGRRYSKQDYPEKIYAISGLHAIAILAGYLQAPFSLRVIELNIRMARAV